MSIVRITLSQDVVDKDHLVTYGSLLPGGEPKTMFASLGQAAVAAINNSPRITSWTHEGSTVLGTLRVQFADGATATYHGVGMLPAPAGNGYSVSAVSVVLTRPGQSELVVSGALTYDFIASGSGMILAPSGQSLAITEVRLDGKLPGGSPNLDPTFGNVSLALKGALTLRPNGELSGTLTRIEATADKFVQSALFEGRFEATNVFGGPQPAQLWGPASTYQVVYQDGSRIDVRDSAIPIEYAGLNAEALGGSEADDDIVVDLPDRLYQAVTVGGREGNDVVSVKGGGGQLDVAAWAGNDHITLLGGSHYVGGSFGTDTVQLTGNRADYTVAYLPPPPPQDPRYTPVGTYEVTDKSGVVNKLSEVERLLFADTAVAIDADGHGGQAYRLYDAAFDRAPDLVGAGFWLAMLDDGVSLRDMATAFMASNEYQARYGSSQTHLELVTRFYQNIHGREPDAGGRDFWVGLLDRGVLDEADVLVAISESPEHKGALAALIGTGFEYTSWAG